MRIELKTMKIENFKGVKNLDINFSNITNIKGTNAAGKTTVFDAFCWCIFGKDSQDVTKFDIKPIKDGKPVSGVDSIVKLTLTVDGSPIILERKYHEVWKTPKGTVDKVFDKHEVKYFINEVPVKAKEYEAKVAEIIKEDQFKMLTNVYYFTKQKADKQRAILFDVLGEVEEEEVIKSNISLTNLLEMLENKTMEELKKETKAMIGRLEKEKKEIPIKLTELEKMKVEDNSQEIIDKIKELRSKKEETNKSIEQAIEVDKLFNEKKLEIANKENDINRRYSEEKEKINEMLDKFKEKNMEMSKNANKPREEAHIRYIEMNDKCKEIEYSIEKATNNLNYDSSKFNDNVETMKALSTELKEIKAKEYKYTGKTDCPTCGAKLDDKKIAAVKAKEEIKFNSAKQSSIDTIMKSGKSLKELNENLKTKIDAAKNQIKVLEAEREKYKKLKDEAYTKWQEMSEVKELSYPGMEEDRNKIVAAQRALKEKFEGEVAALREEEEKLNNTSNIDKDSCKSEIASIDNEIENLSKELAKVEKNNEIDERIRELDEKEREIANKVAELQKTEFMVDEFTRTKVRLIESKISEKFKYISFKLFRTFVGSSNIEECCEATVDGVPYYNVNTAGKINAGLEIINVLGEHYNVQAPIFIDGAESVVEYLPTKSQFIKLCVDGKYKKLTVEGEN